jgi:AraC-like DNA-binding protein
MHDTCKVIVDYIEYMQNTYGYDVAIFDPYGLMHMNSELDQALRGYFIHTNPFCMRVKTNLRLWRICILLKKMIIARIERESRPFWGECYCGVVEYVYPFFSEGQLIGAVCAAGYKGRPINPQLERILCNQTGMTKSELNNLRTTSLKDIPENSESIGCQFGILAKLLEYMAGQNALEWMDSGNQMNSKEQQLHVMRALEYIKEMYAQPIKVKDVADFCYMSESYLQHLVKNSHGCGIYELLLERRLDKACNLLRNTDLKIAEVASLCGYTDPNYFSTSFKNRYGITPRQYRRGE